ncbi:restriction endonuclease subunit S [Hallella colorans]|uniref:Type I restriction enzyme S subunit n=2 Tax=Hallella colorans TaxID=1703337 RepID=A0A2U0U4U5_9BACT|nr:restriction endonuclease subunit S [Hallella colorans]PVX52669.1 type I restriction enzyme S subunit [Hallella colorans]
MHHYEQDVPFEVPRGWVWTTLENCTINRDNERIPIASAIRNKQQNKKYDYYGAAGIIDKVDNYIFNERLLLVGEDGANLLSRAKNNAFFAEGKFWVNNHAHILDSYPKKVLDFVAIVINSMNLEMYITGSAQPKLSQDNLNRIPIPLPPFAEQQRIVAEIERWFALIDTIEKSKEGLETAIKQAKNKILDLAIHGKLVPQDPNDEPASELLKRINPKAQIPCDNEHYAQLPRGWSVCLLENIIEYEQPTDYIVSSTNYDDSYLTPVLTAGKSFIIGYTDEEEGLYSKLPCIIFDDFTTASKLVTFPFKVKSSAMKILQVNQNISIKYVAAFMSITQLIGDTHKRYWISEYSKLPIPIPPKEEQKRIVTAIDNLFNVLDAIMENL